jgi:hypothetical protein
MKTLYTTQAPQQVVENGQVKKKTDALEVAATPESIGVNEDFR